MWEMEKISIIIPTLNEQENISSLLRYLGGLDPQIELIVVDGFSSDETVQLAQNHAKVIQCQRGRGQQLNAGAENASGDILWFIHADCYPHIDSIKAMRQVLAEDRIVGGAFEYNIDQPGLFFRLTEHTSNFKNHLLNLFYGDMGIFVRREIFDKMGGYKNIPLMEDMDFCKRLKDHGRVFILPQRIMTSARRWREEGIMKNMIRNWIIQLFWCCGVSADKMKRWYKFGNEGSEKTVKGKVEVN